MSNVNVGSIHGTATLNASQFVSGANQAVGSLKQLELATAANWWGLRNLGLALAAIPTAAAAGVGASIRAYMEWEDAIAGVERTTFRAQEANETAAEAQQRNADTLASIVDGLKDIASTTPVAASTLAGIAEAAGALGIAETDIISFTKTVADLDATTDLTANSAAVNLARIAGLTGVAGQGYDNLASAILEVGRSTAATEQEIVDIANRIAGIASVAKLSGAEVIGMAGALRSAGVRSEQGGTAFQKTFADIIQAVANGGDNLELFARISGKTSAQLQEDFGSNAADAFADFIAGLGALNAQGENVIGILGQLGITEARQTQTLLLLAQAETQVVNENLKLSKSLETARDAFSSGTAISEIAAKRYKTLTSQIQILRNEIFLAAQGFGATFAPVISFVVERLRDFIAGLSALPSPLKIAAGIMIALSVAVLGLASAAILLGPRLVLAVAALRQLGTTSAGAVGGLAATAVGAQNVTRSMVTMASATSLAASRLNALQVAAINANLANFSSNAARSGTAAAGVGTGAASAVTGLAGMSLWVSRLGKGLGILGAVLTVGSILLTVFGNSLRSQQSALTDVVSANQDLFNILAQNNNQLDESTRQWIKQSDLWPKVQAGAQRYGASLSDIEAIIQGTASSSAYKEFLEETAAAYKDGDKSAKEYSDAVITLSRTFAETRKEAASILGPIQDIIDANRDMEDSFNTEDEIRELEKLRQKLNDQATAHVDFVHALQAQARAQFDLIDAQRAYGEALADARDPTRVLGDLERRLASARRSSQKSQEALAKAETKLATARDDQQESLADALEDVMDAQESYSDSLQKLRDAEEELAELRRGPELKNIVKATNDLKNAQLRLLRAHQDVSDAEWYLNYLREEGASNRDIADAELALQEARQEVENLNQEITESEEELQRAREGASARELADAEEAVADALRETQRAYDDIIDKEREVAQIRQEIAEDRAFLEAERELAEARDDAADATVAVAEAEKALRDARDFGIARNLRQAELDLTDAIFATAQANAEARIAQLRMNGVYVDAGTEAAILAEELGKLVGLAPSAAQNRRLREFIEILNAAPESGPPIEQELPEFDSSFDPGQVPVPLMPDSEEFASGFEEFVDSIPGATADIWRDLWDKYGKELGKWALVAIVGGILAAIFGIPVLVGGAIAAVALLIAELFGDDIVRFLTEKVGPAIKNFFTNTFPDFFLKTVPKAFETVINFFRNFFIKTLPHFFTTVLPTAFFGVVDFFRDNGIQMVHGLIGGITETIWELWSYISGIPGAIFGLLGTVLGLMVLRGAQIIFGLLQGAGQFVGQLFGWIYELPGRLAALLVHIGWWFLAAGGNIIRGILDGIGDVAHILFKWIGDLPKNLYDTAIRVKDWFYYVGTGIIGGILDGLYEFGHLIIDVLMNFAEAAWNSVLRFFGIGSPSKQFAWVGKMMMIGLRDGVDQYGKVATEAATAIAEDTLAAFTDVGIDQAITDLLNTEAARMNLAVGGNGASAAMAQTQPTNVVHEGDTFNLEAITTADPAEIVDEFMWSKLVRIR